MSDTFEIEITVTNAKGEEAKGHAEYKSDASLSQVPHELLQHVAHHAGASRLREIDESR